jgi:hypothetical protein
MALTRKYDLARSTTSEELSRLDRIPAASRDWTRRRGRLVVLLKAKAGVTHDGSLKSFVAVTPIASEASW